MFVKFCDTLNRTESFFAKNLSRHNDVMEFRGTVWQPNEKWPATSGVNAFKATSDFLNDPLRKVGKRALSSRTYFSKHRRPSRPLKAVIDFVSRLAPINSIDCAAHTRVAHMLTICLRTILVLSYRDCCTYSVNSLTHTSLRDLDESFVRCNGNKDVYLFR